MAVLIGEIKAKLAIDLDELPITSRKLEVSAPKGPGNLLVVGSSNAKRLAAVLAAKGIPVGRCCATAGEPRSNRWQSWLTMSGRSWCPETTQL